MEVLIFLIVIVSIISSVASKKKQEQAKRSSQAEQAARVRQAENMRERVEGNIKRPAASTMQPTVRTSSVTTRVHTPQYSGSMAYDSMEGVGGTQGTAFGSTEGMGGTQGRSELAGNFDKPRHIVTPSHETGHAHTESSITGISDCAPDAQPLEFEHEDAYSGVGKSTQALKLDISRNAVLQGVIFSEILGKPRALKRYSRA